ncbi:MAG: hypothetical protein R3B70_02840 [Polyangiaceae bacterium]
MVHQRGKVEEIEIEQPGGYGGGDTCGSIVHTGLSAFNVDSEGQLLGPQNAITRLGGVLPVDVALSKSGSLIAVQRRQRQRGLRERLRREERGPAGLQLRLDAGGRHADRGRVRRREPRRAVPAAGRDHHRQHGACASCSPPPKGVRDTGHDFFHKAPSPPGQQPVGRRADVLRHLAACASCHPEGGDDAHLEVQGHGPRRTQTSAAA